MIAKAILSEWKCDTSWFSELHVAVVSKYNVPSESVLSDVWRYAPIEHFLPIQMYMYVDAVFPGCVTLSLEIILASASSEAELCCTSLLANILE